MLSPNDYLERVSLLMKRELGLIPKGKANCKVVDPITRIDARGIPRKQLKKFLDNL